MPILLPLPIRYVRATPFWIHIVFCNVYACRSGYYHRGICIQNVYVPWQEVKDKNQISYGEAKLKLTESTRPFHEPEYFDQTLSWSKLQASSH